MKRFKFGIYVVLAVMFASASVPIATGNVSARDEAYFVHAETTTERTYSTKDYVPVKANAIDYWGGVSEVDGGGLTTFAHAGLNVPLKGDAIELSTEFTLLSTQPVADGGDATDSWLTYSFSSSAAGATDSTFPYYNSAGYGYFLHITNVSKTNLNCVEVQVVEKGDGTIIQKDYLDNAVGVPITISLKKASDDSLYDLTFTRNSDGANLKTMSDLALNDSLFMSGMGQTYVSTALYCACGGNCATHRAVKWYSVKAHTKDIRAEEVSLSQDVYDYVEGSTYSPDVTVTVDGATLDASNYTVAYANNNQEGTATATVKFIGGEYAGNVIVKNFTIRSVATVEFTSEDTQISSTKYALTDSVTMPTAEKEGQILLGWACDGKLYPEGATVALSDLGATANATLSFAAVYAEFAAQDGVSIRLVEPYGMRFRGYFSKSLIDTVDAYEGVTVTFGSKITSAGSSKFVDIVGEKDKLYESTEKAGYYSFNTVLVNIKEKNMERTYYSTPYLTIEYSNGDTKTFTANTTEGRTYKQIVELAYADVVDEATEVYCYAVEKEGVTKYARISATDWQSLTIIYNSLTAQEGV